MTKEPKLNVFGGVFTPSILTILGVIMYLRLPWIVGSAGLWMTLGIIVAAHVVSITTGLSISSIATDKSVGAGGPYYIVSRSLGLPIGGTLGIALFLGLCFSISLYIIGFSESFLSYIGTPPTKLAIRICGTITLLLITIVTFVSTALAIRTQYLILALIVLSLASILSGSEASVASSPILTPQHTVSFGVLFGIFFPAVTGFTAGVNMSGDLRDPKSALPTGTMAAIAVGFAVYVVLAVYLAFHVEREVLISDAESLQSISTSPAFVIAGIWGATISSALGSVLGAPRILQAIASDRIAPGFFAKGYGASREPRNALLVAFLIGESGILIAELDAIARIVSMVFLTTYGFLNLSCAIESSVSPDFRPQFRIPTSISVIGAVACLLLMVQLDLLAMFGGSTLMLGLYAYLKRRQLQLESGDAWEGIWSSLVRMGLYRLNHSRRQQRNWRPNILMLSLEESVSLRQLAFSLAAGNGLVTDIVLSSSSAQPAAKEHTLLESTPVGYFRRPLDKEIDIEQIGVLIEHYGFAGLEPNTVLVDLAIGQDHPKAFIEMLRRVAGAGRNVLVFAGESNAAKSRQLLDVWWRIGAGNVPFSLALVGALTARNRSASIRCLSYVGRGVGEDYVRTETHRLLGESRVNASVRVIPGEISDLEFQSQVARESSESDLVVLGWPTEIDSWSEPLIRESLALGTQLGSCLFFWASSEFKPALHVDSNSIQSDSDKQVHVDLKPLRLPHLETLARATESFDQYLQTKIRFWFDGGIQELYRMNVELVQGIREVFVRHFSNLDKRLINANQQRRQNVINRVHSAFLIDSEKLLQRFAEVELPAQRGNLERQIESFFDTEGFAPRSSIVVERSRSEFLADESDAPDLRRVKRRRLWLSLGRKVVRYAISQDPVLRYYRYRADTELFEVSVSQFAADSHQLMVQLGKVLDSSKTSLVLLGKAYADDGLRSEFLEKEQETTLAKLDALLETQSGCLTRYKRSLFAGARDLSQAFGEDLDRIDYVSYAKKNLRVPSSAKATCDHLNQQLPTSWFHCQSLLLNRAILGLSISKFQHRLAAIAHRAREQAALGMRNGLISDFDKLRTALQDWLDQEDGSVADQRARLRVPLDLAARFEAKPIVDRLVRETATLTGSLPESASTLSDESIRALELGRSAAPEVRNLSVRGVAQFLLETEFVSGLQSDLERVAPIEIHAVAVARDSVRLLAFHVSEADEVDRELFRDHLRPVVESSLQRISAEHDQLMPLGARLESAFRERLANVIQGTNAYEISKTSDHLTRQFRVAEGKKAIHGMQGRVQRAAAALRRAMVYLLYRRSAGMVLAKRLEQEAQHRGPLAVRVASFVRTLRPSVLEQLPFYYHQLFFGQSSISKSFWVERPVEMRSAKEALMRYRSGSDGALVVIGERFSGKTALCHRIVQQSLSGEQVCWVHPPTGGSCNLEDFSEALRVASQLNGTPEEILDQLRDGSVVVIDDLELWWERVEDGFSVVDLILKLIERYGRRHLIVLGCGLYAFRLLDRLRPLSESSLSIIECGPMEAEALKRVVLIRHGSAGMKFELAGRSEEQLSQWSLANLFSKHFDYSGGVVGVALRSWIAGIRDVQGVALKIEVPDRRNWGVLDELRSEWVALLLQLVLRKHASFAALSRCSGLEDESLSRELRTLCRMGLLVEERAGVFELDAFVQQALVQRMHRRGLLP